MMGIEMTSKKMISICPLSTVVSVPLRMGVSNVHRFQFRDHNETITRGLDFGGAGKYPTFKS